VIPAKASAELLIKSLLRILVEVVFYFSWENESSDFKGSSKFKNLKKSEFKKNIYSNRFNCFFRTLITFGKCIFLSCLKK